MKLLPLASQCIEDLFRFETKNADYFSQWVPPRPAEYASIATLTELVEQQLAEMHAGADYQLFLAYHNTALVGRFNLTNITAHQAEVGYRVSAHSAGQGLASEGLRQLVSHAKAMHLTQLQAYTTAENIGSQRVLTKVGFEYVATNPSAAELQGKPVDLLHYSLALT